MTNPNEVKAIPEWEKEHARSIGRADEFSPHEQVMSLIAVRKLLTTREAEARQSELAILAIHLDNMPYDNIRTNSIYGYIEDRCKDITNPNPESV